MHKRHLTIAVLTFLMCIISIYFGIRIYNANENIHLTHLNEADNIFYDDEELVPTLSFLAACITLPFLLGIGTLELLTILKTKRKVVKNVAFGLMTATCTILVFDVLTIADPVAHDFSKFGFIWICLGLIIVAGNMLSYAIYRFSTPESKGH